MGVSDWTSCQSPKSRLSFVTSYHHHRSRFPDVLQRDNLEDGRGIVKSSAAISEDRNEAKAVMGGRTHAWLWRGPRFHGETARSQ